MRRNPSPPARANRPGASFSPRRISLAASATLLAVSAVGLADPVGAQDGSGSQELAAQVEQIVAKRASLGEKISVLEEQANLAKVELVDIESRSEVNEADVSSAEKSMGEAKGQVRRYAVKAFTGGLGTGNAASHQDPSEVIRSRTLLATAQGNREQAVEQVRAARSDLTAKQQLLDETAAAKATAQQRIESSRSEMKVVEGELAASEAQVKGDLADALEREERQRVAAERAEAERRQAEAEAQVKADAEAAAEQAQAEAEEAAAAEADAEQAAETADSPTSASPSSKSPSSKAPSSKAPSSKAPSSQAGSGKASTKPAAAPKATSPSKSGVSSASPKPTSAPTTRAPRPTAPPATAAPKPVAPPPPPPPPAAAPSSQGQRAVQAALSMRGTPYRWGGETPGGGFDCSGLVLWAYAQAGRPGIPHSSRMQVSMGRRISVGELVPGDLVAYGSPVHHIGIYIGGGQYVHAPSTGDVVKTASIYRFNGTPIAVRI